MSQLKPKKIELTKDQWAFINKEYGKLMHTITSKISGDYSFSREDYLQDLYITVIDAVEGFLKQGCNGSVEDFLDTPGFRKYIKTALWHKKGNIGKRISQRYNITRDTVPIHLETEEGVKCIQIVQKNSQMGDDLYFDFFGKMSEDEERVVKVIVENPSVLLKSGLLDSARVARTLGYSIFKLNKIVEGLEYKLNKNL